MKAGWQTRKLGELLHIQNGYAFDSKKFSPSGEMPLIRIRDLKAGIETETKYSGAYDEKYVVRSGDFLIGMDGEFGCYEWKGNPSLLNQRVCRLQDFDTALLPRFLFYGVNSHLKEIEDVTGFTTVKHISSRQILDIDFLSPPFSEQQRIVGILDDVFDGISTAKAKAEQNLQNARALFESYLQSVFTQRGEGWVEKRLGDICERVSVGHVGPTSEFYCNEDEGIPFLRSQNVRRGHLDWDGLQYVTKEFHKKLRKSQLRAGDLLFVRVGANRGDCCSVPNDLGEINCANIVFARPTEGNATYLERYCDSTHGREQLLGMTTGSAQGVINTSSVAEFIVPLPPPLEQKRIVDSLNVMQAETQRLESLYQRKLAALGELKKSLLHQAFSGAL